MFKYFISTTIIILLAGSGCSRYEGGFKLPGVYRVDIQQGNVIEEELLARLKPGMDKDQVRYIMGTPVLIDPFHTDRWEYIHTFSKGGGKRQQEHISIYFDENEKLSSIEGDIAVNLHNNQENIEQQTKIVEVPLKKGKHGFFRKMLNLLPFVGDDEPKPAKQEEKNEATETPDSGPGLTSEEAVSRAD